MWNEVFLSARGRALSRLQSQNPIIPERIKKTISRVGYENAKGLIQCVTVTGGESLSKTVVYERDVRLLNYKLSRLETALKVSGNLVFRKRYNVIHTKK